jgi:glutathione-regulated potassium-efflux system ancillary protein KefC
MKRLGLGSVLGYLAAGTVIGPWGLGFVKNVEDIRHFAEFGVVLLLFIIGLELKPKTLWTMRRSIVGTGGSQLLFTSILLLLIGLVLGYSFNTSLVVAMGLSLSSTAIALQSLKERNLMATHAGNSTFSVLLFQDIAVIPILALLPALGVVVADSGESAWLGLFKAVALIGAIVVGGHYLTRPIFRYIANTGMREIFTAFSLLLVFGISLLVNAVGMSMALGAFLAGVLLAESEYRHELEVEIEPFKGLLMGLFFISVGMSIDFGLLVKDPLIILALVLLLILVKGAVLWLLAKAAKIPKSQSSLFVFLLSQGGEFAFVIFSVASGSGVLEQATVDYLVVIVALSMLSTPFLLLLYQHVIAPSFINLDQAPEPDTIEEHNPVIIAGFGRFGRTVGRLLHANGIATTILDHDPDQIEAIRRFGYKVYYGDASRYEILHAAGAEKAKLLIITIDDADVVLDIIDQVQKHFPNLTILTRARNNGHVYEILRRGVSLFRRELYDSALCLGEEALKQLGFGAYRSKTAAQVFHAYDKKLLRKLQETETPEDRRLLSLQAREDIEQILTADAEEIAKDNRQGWD